MLELPQFARNRACELCPLHVGVKNVCIPARACNSLSSFREKKHDIAVLVVGEKPGVEEDVADATMVGVTGKYVDRIYLRYRALTSKADVYLANAVRCRIPGNGDPTDSQLGKCRPYLLDDIARLKAAYKSVVLLACGSKACKTITGMPLEKFWRYQGSTHHYVPVFATYNSAMLLPGRNPSAISAIEDHLSMLHDYLETGRIPCDLVVPTMERSACPGGPVDILSLDIETYGAVDGLPVQTVFHPRKSIFHDHVRPEDVIQTVALAWRERSTQLLRSSVYVWPDEKDAFKRAVLVGLEGGGLLLGMNLPFDLMFLRAFAGRGEWFTKPGMDAHGIKLADLAIANYLNSDVRPEKSLKEISPLLRVADYSEEKSLKDGERYESKYDTSLHRYNALDAVATLVSWERLVESTKRLYPRTFKFSSECLDWYSDLLWSVVEMSEAGVAVDERRLSELEQRSVRRMERLLEIVKLRYGAALAGKGSRTYLQRLIDDAVVEANLVGDERITRTAKTDKISTEKDNIHLLLGLLPTKSAARTQLRFLEAYRHYERVVGTYCRPMLGMSDKRRSSQLIDGCAFPSWYPVPSKSDDAVVGGTKQGRLSAKGPAVQTLPPQVEKCLVSRYRGGTLFHVDYSQAELRVAGFLSNDREMQAEYQQPDADLHKRTTIRIFGADYVRRPDASRLRKCGKTVNFLTQNGGQAARYQATLRKMYGIELPLQECQSIIDAFWRTYCGLRVWWDDNIARAIREGYIELPITGQSRQFLGSPAAVRRSYASEIINFPIQTTAANCMLAGQRALQDAVDADGRGIVVARNVHDAIDVDCPPGREDCVRKNLSLLTCSEYQNRLQCHYGRVLPLKIEVIEIKDDAE